MPISGVLVTCKENCLEDVHQAIGDHPRLEIGDQSGCMLVVVTDTETLADDRAEIDWLASLYGDKSKKIVSLWSMGMNLHSRGTWINNLVYNLHLLTGKISQPGNGPFSLTGQPSACGSVREVGTLTHLLPGSVRFAESAACQNQAFCFENRIFGLQFHLEITKQGAEGLISNCGDEIVEGPFIQSAKRILGRENNFIKANEQMSKLLDAIALVTG